MGHVEALVDLLVVFTAAGVAMAVLLFQDLLVVLFMLLVPLLAGRSDEPGAGSRFWLAFVEGMLVVARIVLAARFLITPFLRLVFRTHNREIFRIAVLEHLGIHEARMLVFLDPDLTTSQADRNEEPADRWKRQRMPILHPPRRPLGVEGRVANPFLARAGKTTATVTADFPVVADPFAGLATLSDL